MPLPPDTQIVIAGAGPHGLAMTIHCLVAAPHLRDRITVVDPSGQWLRTWRDQFARLEISHLRSPGVHHPGVRPEALMKHTRAHDLPTSGLPYGLPMTEAFSHFCDDLIKEHDLASFVVRGEMIDVDCDEQQTCRVTIATGEQHTMLPNSRLIIASNPHRPNIPPWAHSLDDDVLRLGHQVDIRQLGDLTGTNVVVVGGGLTAAHLACGAAEHGASVTLAFRDGLRESPFDTDPGWLGPKELRAFDEIDDPSERLRTAMAARNGGTIPPWMFDRLEGCSNAITILEHAEVASVASTADQVWLATGTAPSIEAMPALDRLRDRIPSVDGYPVPGADLTLADLPIHVTGRLATIELGPAAGNLWGAQRAAERISHSLTGIDLRLEFHPIVLHQRPDAPPTHSPSQPSQPSQGSQP